ncbi:polysaccharide pyruvyl transferase family protein [Heyndrickxia coagulans]|uniref:Polysaccharide pyruvyl transferase family protein n=1 Tax=Heyndrickxia coagulans TaxID=1398 RepID=A0AAW7CGV3_HEYCO|nr:polysaccharide pyruvyl transferase family protein [Heyndrickxia coagulans]MDL5039751.1 polysaccharide pyruvyl transferase family protein [Heyndrickxia coagulans]
MLLKKIKKIIPMTWKVYINHYLKYKNDTTYVYDKEIPKIIVGIAADYGNLGDVAITFAQVQMLKSLFPKHKIVIFPFKHTSKMLKVLKKSCTSRDIITLIGGGNMGNRYEGIEEARRTIVHFFPDNKIVSFPQTIDFSNDNFGKKSLSKTIKVYSKHKNLSIFARESQSYNLMKKYFGCNKIGLVPDIVLSLNKEKPNLIREGIVISFRSDNETIFSNNQREHLINELKRIYAPIKYYDTCIDNFNPQNSYLELTKIWGIYKGSKLVITDRLHGMIFCAITKTPCIVFPNDNHKIVGSYNDWLKNLEYIELIEKFELNKVVELIDYLLTLNIDNCISLNLKEKFKPLINELIQE